MGKSLYLNERELAEIWRVNEKWVIAWCRLRLIDACSTTTGFLIDRRDATLFARLHRQRLLRAQARSAQGVLPL